MFDDRQQTSPAMKKSHLCTDWKNKNRQQEVPAETEHRHCTLQVKEQIPPEKIKIDHISSHTDNAEDQIVPGKKNHTKILIINRNDEDRIPQRNKQAGSRNIAKGPCAEVCTFNNIYSVTLLTKKKYKVDISFGLTTSHIRSTNCISVTGSGPNILREDLIEPDWRPSICVCNGPRLKSAINQTVKVVGPTVLHLRIEKSCT